MKIICQNCYEILADRDKEQNTITLYSDKFPEAIRELSAGAPIVTLTCPKCACKLQVRV